MGKLRQRKFRYGMPAVLRISSKASFLIPASLMVFKSVTTKDRVLGSTASTNSGIGSISFSLKYGAYLPTLSLEYSSVVFHLQDQELGVVSSSFSLCPGYIIFSE